MCSFIYQVIGWGFLVLLLAIQIGMCNLGRHTVLVEEKIVLTASVFIPDIICKKKNKTCFLKQASSRWLWFLQTPSNSSCNLLAGSLCG